MQAPLSSQFELRLDMQSLMRPSFLREDRRFLLFLAYCTLCIAVSTQSSLHYTWGHIYVLYNADFYRIHKNIL